MGAKFSSRSEEASSIMPWFQGELCLFIAVSVLRSASGFAPDAMFCLASFALTAGTRGNISADASLGFACGKMPFVDSRRPDTAS